MGPAAIAFAILIGVIAALGAGGGKKSKQNGQLPPGYAKSIELIRNKLIAGCKPGETWDALLARVLTELQLPGPWPPVAGGQMWRIALWERLKPIAIDVAAQCEMPERGEVPEPETASDELDWLPAQWPAVGVIDRYICYIVIGRDQRMLPPLGPSALASNLRESLGWDVTKSWNADAIINWTEQRVKEVMAREQSQDAGVRAKGCNAVGWTKLVVYERTDAKRTARYVRLQKGDTWGRLLNAYYPGYSSDSRKRIARYVNNHAANRGLQIETTRQDVIDLVGKYTISFFPTWRKDASWFLDRFQIGSGYAIVYLPELPDWLV